MMRQHSPTAWLDESGRVADLLPSLLSGGRGPAVQHTIAAVQLRRVQTSTYLQEADDD
jgi:hypothetical protein